VVHTCEAQTIEHGRLIRDSPRDPLKGHTTWTASDVSWIPEDNPEFALNPDSNWYDVELCAPIADTTAFQDAPTPVKTKKKKSLRSVRFTSADFVLDVVDFSWLEKASCILEAKLSKPIS